MVVNGGVYDIPIPFLNCWTYWYKNTKTVGYVVVILI